MRSFMGQKMTNKCRMLGFACVVLFLALFLSCGGGGMQSSPSVRGEGNVALFVSDNISFYRQVVSTITDVRLVNSGNGGVCHILGSPVTYDISNLTNMAQFATLVQCPAGNYNRIDIDFKKGAHVMNQLGDASDCAYVSSIDESGQVRDLACDATTGVCTLSVRGGTRDRFLLVQADQYNTLGIDFDLKKFTIADFGDPSACAMTMTASLLNTADLNNSGRAYGVTGSISRLDTAAHTFMLSAGGKSLSVSYAKIVPALQPDIDKLLGFAQAEGLPVNVLTGDIDFAAGRVSADRLAVKAAGPVTNVQNNPTWTFSLEYLPGSTLKGSHKPPADVQGTFINGAWVNVKFDGYDDDSHAYRASSIEVLPSGMVLNE